MAAFAVDSYPDYYLIDRASKFLRGDAVAAANVFIGLLLRDTQLRVIQGAVPALTDAQIADRADAASRLFLRLYGVS